MIFSGRNLRIMQLSQWLERRV
uniref:Restin homolog n=2 Tax=Rhizophora mucronata TaxID=61149 RepID=A0A2P2MSF7_RHIMU